MFNVFFFVVNCSLVIFWTYAFISLIIFLSVVMLGSKNFFCLSNSYFIWVCIIWYDVLSPLICVFTTSWRPIKLYLWFWMADVRYFDIWSSLLKCSVKFIYFNESTLVSNKIASYILPWICDDIIDIFI